jgi:S1-C subfamily serine protease
MKKSLITIAATAFVLFSIGFIANANGISITMPKLKITPIAHHNEKDNFSVESFDTLNGYKTMLHSGLSSDESTANPNLFKTVFVMESMLYAISNDITMNKDVREAEIIRLKKDISLAKTLIDEAKLRATVYVGVSSTTEMKKGRSLQSSGSGFIIDNKQCLVMTNDHVAGDGVTIKVTYVTGFTENGNEITNTTDAEIIGTPDDKDKNDLALLKLNSCENTFWAPIGDSDILKHGEKVTAIGAPFGFKWTITSGVVSNDQQHNLGKAAWALIQTDAAVNPGNSGGPLFNTAGEIIGVNSLIYSGQGENNGIAFAHSSNIIRLFLRNTHLYGHMITPRFGVMVSDITKNRANVLEIPQWRLPEYSQYYGVEVSGFTDVSAGREGGLEIGDVILEFNSKPIFNGFNLIREVDKTILDELITVRVLRDGEVHAFQMTLNNTWAPPEPHVTSGPYVDNMGWDLEMDPDKYNGIDLPVIANAAMLSPAFNTLAFYVPEISGGITEESAIDFQTPGLRSAWFRAGIPIPAQRVQKANFLAIKGIQATGMHKLDLTTIPAEDRIEYLDNYITLAHMEKRSIILEVTDYTSEKIIQRAEFDIPEDIEDLNVRGQTMSAEAIRKLLQSIKDMPEKEETSETFWVDIFPKEFNG